MKNLTRTTDPIQGEPDMSTMTLTAILDALGFTVGVFGVCAVVFLTIVLDRNHNTHRLFVILVVASSLILMNVTPWFDYTIANLGVRLLSYMCLLGLFVWESYHIWHEGVDIPQADNVMPNRD
jgi:hypothetical protein